MLQLLQPQRCSAYGEDFSVETNMQSWISSSISSNVSHWPKPCPRIDKAAYARYTYYYACIATKWWYASCVCELHSNQNNNNNNNTWGTDTGACMYISPEESFSISNPFFSFSPSMFSNLLQFSRYRWFIDIRATWIWTSADNPSNIKALPYMAGNRAVGFILEFHECSSLSRIRLAEIYKQSESITTLIVIINVWLIANICDNANLSIKTLFNIA